MNIDGLVAQREAAYRGEGAWRQPAVYNGVDELLALREAGYLIGPDARTVMEQRFSAHRDDPQYSEAKPGEAPARHWTSDEMASVRRAFSQGEHVARIRQAFPVETHAIDARNHFYESAFSDPDLFGAWNHPAGEDGLESLDPSVVEKLDAMLRRKLIQEQQPRNS